MDFIYSCSLLISLAAGSSAILFGILAIGRREPGLPLIRAGLSAITLVVLALIASVAVHRRWGYGTTSTDPMDVARFAGSHTAFLVASFIIVVGLVVVLCARQRNSNGESL